MPHTSNIVCYRHAYMVRWCRTRAQAHALSPLGGSMGLTHDGRVGLTIETNTTVAGSFLALAVGGDSGAPDTENRVTPPNVAMFFTRYF